MAILGLVFGSYAAIYGVIWVLSWCFLTSLDHLLSRRRRRLGLEVSVGDVLARAGHEPVRRGSGGRHHRRPVTGRHALVRTPNGRPARRGAPVRRAHART
jgi:hypothetical protein